VSNRDEPGMERLNLKIPVIKKASVLIIDDEEGIRRLLTKVLEENGYSADSVGDGKEGVKKSNEKFYNVAFIDIMLPDSNGIELLPRFKETTPRMRKIIITGNPSLQNAVGAVNNGADAYVIKPLDVEKVLATLEEQLEKQKKERETMDQVFNRGRARARIEVLGREATETPEVR
jgi:DNA-binding NtrC family response regulator